MNRTVTLLVALILAVWPFRTYAQYPIPNGQILSSAQVDQLVGPIALYPDPLIAQVLPAATQPSEIAVAYAYVTGGGDPNAIDAQPWDSSVKAVARYPDVIKLLDANLPWTTQLGQAFLNQPTEVMNAVQRLRAQAQSLGNLATSPQETIVADEGLIEIEPTDSNLIYVPYYDPGVVFYQRYYGRPFITFGVGFGIGLWLNHDFDWHDHRVVYWDHDHPRPNNFWHEPPSQRRDFYHSAPQWHPANARVENRTVINNNYGGRGDRGYAPSARGPEPSRPVVISHPAPVENRSVEVHSIGRPAGNSAFSGIQNAQAARESSNRGVQSRPPTVTHSAPAPAHMSAPSASHGVGGGNNGRR